MSLAEDTALTRVGERAWRATFDERWAVVRGPFGGWLAAVLGEVTQCDLDDLLAPLGGGLADSGLDGHTSRLVSTHNDRKPSAGQCSSRHTSTETSCTGSGIGGSGLAAFTVTLSAPNCEARRSATTAHRRSSVL